MFGEWSQVFGAARSIPATTDEQNKITEREKNSELTQRIIFRRDVTKQHRDECKTNIKIIDNPWPDLFHIL